MSTQTYNIVENHFKLGQRVFNSRVCGKVVGTCLHPDENQVLYLVRDEKSRSIQTHSEDSLQLYPQQIVWYNLKPKMPLTHTPTGNTVYFMMEDPSNSDFVIVAKEEDSEYHSPWFEEKFNLEIRK